MPFRITHPGCDAIWTGTTIEHCSSCHLTFSSTLAGDTHRVGLHGVTEGPDRRRCLTVEEMRSKTIRRGVMKGEPWFRITVNAHGTESWGQNKVRDTRWDVFRDGTGELGAMAA